jgi:hypothetical protein
MITFITAFKKFNGHPESVFKPYGIIQRSAVWSWRNQGIKIIAPDNELGLMKGVSPYEIVWLKGVKTASDIGFDNFSPVFRDLMLDSIKFIDTPLIAYINSDCIIVDNFYDNLVNICKKRGTDFFSTGTRYSINLKIEINSEESYKKVLNSKRVIGDISTSSDIFISTKENFIKMANDMPEFIIGRYAWDNWIHLYAIDNFKNLYNCTNSLTILHCNHDYKHILVQEGYELKGAPSAVYNDKLWEQTKKNRTYPKISNWEPL